MKTGDVMTRTVATCTPTQTLEDAARSMWECDVGCLVVIDEHRRPVGMITDRDVAMAAYTRGVPLRDIHVEWTMANDLCVCSLDTALAEVETRMNKAQVRRVPVLDASGALAGIISIADLARRSQSSPLRFGELPGVMRTLAGISERRLDQPDSR